MVEHALGVFFILFRASGIAVLILIVVEHALGAWRTMVRHKRLVLILIVVEHALGEWLDMAFSALIVLILIVVEHALGVRSIQKEC